MTKLLIYGKESETLSNSQKKKLAYDQKTNNQLEGCRRLAELQTTGSAGTRRSRVADILKKAKILKSFNQFTGIVITATVHVNIDVSNNKKRVSA